MLRLNRAGQHQAIDGAVCGGVVDDPLDAMADTDKRVGTRPQSCGTLLCTDGPQLEAHELRQRVSEPVEVAVEGRLRHAGLADECRGRGRTGGQIQSVQGIEDGPAGGTCTFVSCGGALSAHRRGGGVGGTEGSHVSMIRDLMDECPRGCDGPTTGEWGFSFRCRCQPLMSRTWGHSANQRRAISHRSGRPSQRRHPSAPGCRGDDPGRADPAVDRRRRARS